MLFAHFLLVILTVASGKAVYDNIGYFWHITDFHYDPFFSNYEDNKKGCWKSEGMEGGTIRNYKKPAGRFGDYRCDSPWELIESAARVMAARQGDNVEFVLWTGDTLSHSVRHFKNPKLQLEYVQNLTDLLQKTFTSSFVFPALGHDDPFSKVHLGIMWSRWLPTDSLKTFESGGYYIIERKTLQLQIVMLNTNLMTRKQQDEEAKKQIEWLDKVLQKCESLKQTVYLVGHIPPGVDERRGHTEKFFSEYYNKKYIEIVQKYSTTIIGQFFGHFHSDTFRVVYNEDGSATSWILLAPSLTPRRISSGQNNPGLRLYKFNKHTGDVFDYTQYYLDLSKANRGEVDWQVEYNFSSYYGVTQITPANMNGLAKRITSHNENDTFSKYFRANSVKVYNESKHVCDSGCALSHFCAITNVDYSKFNDCLKTASSAFLSSQGAPFVRGISLLFRLFVFVVVFHLCVL